MEKKTRVRGGIKGQLTRFANFVDSHSEGGIEHLVVETRYDNFRGLLGRFDSVQSEIENYVADSEEQLKDQLEERIKFEDEFYAIQARFVEILNKTRVVSECPSERFSQERDVSDSAQRVRLPRLELPQFDGCLTDYRAFRDVFASLIDQNMSLSEVDKLLYLRASLKGEAFQLIQSLPTVSQSYDHALTLLRERYDNSRCIKQAHLKALFELPPVESKSVHSLRNILDIVTKNVMSLASMGEKVEFWNSILVYIVTSRLDLETRCLFENEFNSKREPTFEQLKTFINSRCATLERLSSSVFAESKPRQSGKEKCFMSDRKPKCDLCLGEHWFDKCNQLLQLSVSQRREKVKNLKKCFKCLRSDHFSRDCVREGCSKCQQGHHDLLHVERASPTLDCSQSIARDDPVSLALTKSPSMPVLLFTVMVRIRRRDGRLILARGILDSGSQINFVSSRLLRRLSITPSHVDKSVDGIGGNECELRSYVELNVMSAFGDFSMPIGAYVLDRITSDLPQQDCCITEVTKLARNLQLADQNFDRSGPIDLLLSNAVFVHVLKGGVKTFGTVKLINTSFGWVVGGTLPRKSLNCQPVSFLIDSKGGDFFDLTKFWELEEVPVKSEEINFAERKFSETLVRDENGRFVIQLPFLSVLPNDCRYSRPFALSRFRGLERRFERSPEFREAYDTFMREYLEKKFIEEVPAGTAELKSAYYLPHHAVIKEDSLTTRLRVVFSGKDTMPNQMAINLMLETGPRLQNDLVRSLLRFRMNKIAFSADVEKMYCMIRVSEKHRDFLRFFYRFRGDSEVRVYRLCSLPFGLNCSPFIAIRCLKELGHLNSERYPQAGDVILNDSYVDDILSGADDIPAAQQLCMDFITVCGKGGFSLRKWKSNSEELLAALNQSSDHQSKEFVVDDSVSKVLGMTWNARLDSLSFSIDSKFSGPCTKRSILSWIARIFDPLGLLSPVLVLGKILIQRLWTLKLSWDDAVPSDVEKVWKKWIAEFPSIESFSLTRLVKYGRDDYVVAFCDASEKAFGCCVYLVTENGSRLVFAKSRVAPVKIVTLARLELCAAVLCSKAVSYVIESLGLREENCILFSDSKIVLAWISKPAYVWRTFVANRVAAIQNALPHGKWSHVSSSRNPADLVSRGIYPVELIECEFWWNGPDNLNQLLRDLPAEEFSTDLDSKSRVFVGLNVDVVRIENIQNEILACLIERFSNVEKIKRIYAWVLRFVSNLKSHSSRSFSPALDLTELDASFIEMIRFVQRKHFADSIERLRVGKPLKCRDSLLSLNPILGEDSLLRVGGRLERSSLPYDRKHPIILPKDDPITKLIIRDEHIRCNHLGLVGLIGILRQRFWVVNARSTVRSVLRRCFSCFRCEPRKTSQMMGDLPVERVEGSRAFVHTGIDLCGPFFVRPTRKRGNSTTKCYVALFICMASKAVHLEMVFDLTSESFLSSFRRFSSRRGIPSVVFTDNATNFVGVKNTLVEWYELLSSSELRQGFGNELLASRVQWKFIPPRTPNFGGLWESNIKSFKRLFLKCAGESRLTIEEFNTLLMQVEAALNSRPLCEVSDSSDDLDCLTPGHFLIGQPLKMLPCPISHEFKGGLTKRWEHVQQLFRDFWRRWSLEYVQNLQVRKINRGARPNLVVGDIGVVVDDTLPPLRWRLGRVIQVIPGRDGLARVVVIRTKQGIVKRGVGGFCRFDFEPGLSDFA